MVGKRLGVDLTKFDTVALPEWDNSETWFEAVKGFDQVLVEYETTVRRHDDTVAFNETRFAYFEGGEVVVGCGFNPQSHEWLSLYFKARP